MHKQALLHVNAAAASKRWCKRVLLQARNPPQPSAAAAQALLQALLLLEAGAAESTRTLAATRSFDILRS